MSNFTTAQLAQFQKELTEAFHYHDKDSDGKIPAKVSKRGWRASTLIEREGRRGEEGKNLELLLH